MDYLDIKETTGTCWHRFGFMAQKWCGQSHYERSIRLGSITIIHNSTDGLWSVSTAWRPGVPLTPRLQPPARAH